ncbi:putative bifunctional diguanylate cyclase/phosphodiesterase [Ferrimonas lipolytica]|uniref:EAL domain-containing protein n=1 Tax=Ferrimonas lipolytica TaxID=2724191 RepID=A0A6H1UDI7_9GAMM|nr:EAL domain-containing protein [Ferrimonas lipolytica]QIZ77141.1 EAL domain-containing protein [Ferrimonas lipolytica]
MSIFNFRKNQIAITSAGILLIAYLLILLGLTHIGQNRLKEAQLNELHLKVNNYSRNLYGNYMVNKEELAHLAADKSVQSFFANRASGMSMEYGLGASLFNVDLLFSKTLADKRVGDACKYKRLQLVSFDQQVIIDSHPSQPSDLSYIPFAKLLYGKEGHKLYSVQKGLGAELRLVQKVYHFDKAVALLIADINNEVIIQGLAAQEHENYGSFLALQTGSGRVVGWNSFVKQFAENAASNVSISSKVGDTDYSIIGIFEPISQHDLFTSSWFIAAISLLAFPVLGGFFYLIKINNSNIVLRTEIDLSERQQHELAVRNNQLSVEVARRVESEQQLVYQANHDAMTGLANRTCAQELLQQLINQWDASKNSIMVILVDIDHFKQINDSKGHFIGDEVLKQTSERLQGLMRKEETVARFGGDEFVIISPCIESRDVAGACASEILSVFEQPFVVDGTEFFVTASIGIASYPCNGHTAETVVQHADSALHQVKDSGRNGYRFFDSSMSHGVQRKLLMDSRLRKALNNNELELHYQPIVELASGKIIAVEALMRWHDAELGFVSPTEFIPLAERTGVINQLGEQALRQACINAQAWQSIAPISVAVNFSSVQFRQCEPLLMKIERILSSTGLDPKRLDIEVTESLLISESGELRQTLQQLQALGPQLSIDDFGTGYSALSYLQRFSFNKLKIDRSFLQHMEHNEPDQALVKAILAMAAALDLKVVAEGIEAQWQADFLTKHQCQFGQGYLYSKPLPAEEFEALLRQQTPL